MHMFQRFTRAIALPKHLAGIPNETIPMLRGRIFFVVNPMGGKGKVHRAWPSIKRQLQRAGLSFEYAETQAPLHAIDLVAKATTAGFRRIVAVGGDGTLNELVNGLMLQDACSPEEVQISILPLGTGNDWIRTQKIPKKIKQWIERLKIGAAKKQQDIGIADYVDAKGLHHRRYFVNVAGMGYDAFVVRALEQMGKKSASSLLYYFMILRCLGKYQAYEHRLLFGESRIEKKIYTLNVGICRYSGGGMQFVPHAEPNDGLLALTYIEDLPKREILCRLHWLFSGKIVKHSKVTTLQTPAFEVEAVHSPLLLETDGEFIGACSKVTFSISPVKLQLLI